AATVHVARLGTVLGWGMSALVGGYVAWRLALRLRVRRALRTVGLTPTEVRDLQASGANLLVIDVRSPLAVRENPRRIAGAVPADREQLEGLATTLPPDRPIVADRVWPNGASRVRAALQPRAKGCEGAS